MARELESLGIEGMVYKLETDDPPVTFFTVDGLSPPREDESVRAFDVTIEFKPDEYALDLSAFVDGYLRRISEVNATQEEVTEKIRRDLREGLDVEDVFVEISYGLGAKKITQSGKPA